VVDPELAQQLERRRVLDALADRLQPEAQGEPGDRADHVLVALAAHRVADELAVDQRRRIAEVLETNQSRRHGELLPRIP
jgi:hypothetical protein